MELDESILVESKALKGRPKGVKTMWGKHDAVHWVRQLDATGMMVKTDAVNPDCEYCKRKLKIEMQKKRNEGVDKNETI